MYKRLKLIQLKYICCFLKDYELPIFLYCAFSVLLLHFGIFFLYPGSNGPETIKPFKSLWDNLLGLRTELKKLIGCLTTEVEVLRF